ARARLDELARVVAVRAADDHDDLALAREILGSLLPLFGGLTDGVDEPHVGARKPSPDERDQAPHVLDRLRGLRGDADARMRREPPHIVLVADPVPGGELLGRTA